MKLTIKEITVFSLLGSVMYLSKMIMELLPNVHLLGTFVVALTVVYRKKALFPIYVFVFITGLFSGFATWWLPYLYLWTVLWAVVMLLPRNIPAKVRPLVYMIVCALHGYAYGTLYAPAQALIFGLNYKQMLAWIVAGLPWDFVHGTSNFFCGILIQPLINTLLLAEKASSNR
ncbi:MAG: hypothetical protein IKU54_05175 [Oscillospiraceae bacterium]|nr:hypothetical protein [Oscillospiraceae bacterium]